MDANAPSLGGIPVLGGYINSQDIAPSVIFLVWYVAVLGGTSYRCFRRQLPLLLAFRPVLLMLARIGAMIVRLILVNTTSLSSNTLNLYIAEIVLLSLGPIFLTFSLLEIIRRHVSVMLSETHMFASGLQKILRLVTVALLACIVLTIYSSTIQGDPAQMSLSKTLRQAASYLLLAIVGACALLLVLLWTSARQPSSSKYQVSLTRKLTINSVFTALLLIVVIYKAIQTESTSLDQNINLRPVFW